VFFAIPFHTSTFEMCGRIDSRQVLALLDSGDKRSCGKTIAVAEKQAMQEQTAILVQDRGEWIFVPAAE
jgi:hypothetical protein